MEIPVRIGLSPGRGGRIHPMLKAILTVWGLAILVALGFLGAVSYQLYAGMRPIMDDEYVAKSETHRMVELSGERGRAFVPIWVQRAHAVTKDQSLLITGVLAFGILAWAYLMSVEIRASRARFSAESGPTSEGPASTPRLS